MPVLLRDVWPDTQAGGDERRPTPRHCLAALGNAVNWEAEKLYGVEGLGPFDEF